MKFAVGVVCVAVAGFVSSVACASGGATLTGVQGQVLVNRGEGFRQVSSSADLRAGDRILLRQGSVAELDYGDGCRVQLNIGVPATVASSSPCVRSTAQTTPPAPTGTAAGWLIGGGIGLAAGVGIGYAVGNDDDSGDEVCVTGNCF